MGRIDAAGKIRGLIDESALAAKMASDPRIQRELADNLGGLDPALAARVKAGDPAASLEAYRQVVAAGGALPARQLELPLTGDVRGPGVPVGQPRGPGMSGDRVAAHNDLRDSWPVANDASADEVMESMSQFSPEQRQYLQALRANDWLGFDYPSQAASAGLGADAMRRWEMSPDLVAARQSLINSRLRGPGVPGALSGPGVPGALSGPGVRGGQLIPSPGQPPAVAQRAPVDAEFIPDGELIVRNPDGSRNALSADRPVLEGENIPRRGLPQYRGKRKPPNNTGRKVAAAAAGAGLVGLGYALRDQPDGVTDTSGTADLHAEQSPVPSVETPPEPTAEMFFAQARQLIDQLNAMRREAGGEVPEAPQIMAQVRRLQAQGDQMRNAPTYRPSDPGDPSQQAQMLIQDLNARRRAAGGEVPDAPRVMAEVRRLQAMGDAQQNSGYGRSADYSQRYRSA